MSEDDPSVEDQIREFEEAIGQRVNSKNAALEALRAHMIAMGKDPDNQEMPDEVRDQIARDNDDGVPDWVKEEEEKRRKERLEFEGPKGRKKKQPATDGWDMDIEW